MFNKNEFNSRAAESPDVEVRESAIEGRGCFARRDFAAGEKVIDIVYSEPIADLSSLDPSIDDRHLDTLPDGSVVLMYPPAAYVNHCCEANSSVTRRDGNYMYVAVRPIKAGEEITCHFSVNNFQDSEMECHCGAPTCLGVVPTSFWKLPVDVQRTLAPLLDDWFKEKYRDKLGAILP